MAERTILVPLDGSRTALRAVPYAAALVNLGQAERVVLFMALPTREGPDTGTIDAATHDQWERAALRRLRTSARRLQSLGVGPVEIETRWGVQDADEIVAAAERHGASLIAMGTHGRSGLARALLGSVAMGVLQRATAPCLFVPPGARLRQVHLRRALLALDGSPLSRQAIPHAQALAKAGVRVTVLRAVPLSSTFVPFAVPGAEGYVPMSVIEDVTAAAEEDIRKTVAEFPAGTEGETLVGAPGRAIIDYAHENGIDLIIMTTHARGALGRALLGSVTDRVMRTAKVPVLVVRPKAG